LPVNNCKEFITEKFNSYFCPVKFFKGLLSVFLVVCFLSSAVGISVYKHYCGDFLAEISLYVQSNPCADEGGEDACNKGKEMDCCDDETEFYRLQLDSVKPTIVDLKIQFVPKKYLVLFTPQPTQLVDQVQTGFSLKEKPTEKIPIYKRLHRFTLYG